ncbi:MAG: hypothetical protein LUF35_09330 [Lachnospiraceae bacterium]|nr:hypothetical protein [Lachnospiraceae bacterium]
MNRLNSLIVLFPLCTAAVLLLAAPMIYVFRFSEMKNKKFALAAYVLLLVWIARFLVGYLAGFVFSEESSGLSFVEEIMNSLIHALQTFSMDEDYTDYTVTGKHLLESVGLSNWAIVYGFFMSLLNICAPILGGAILLDILTNLFPKFKLRFLSGKDVFVFSELNDASVTLAEDICAEDHFRLIMGSGEKSRTDGNQTGSRHAGKNRMGREFRNEKPVLVFTDTYADESEESSAELIDRAKALGAICVREDMMFLSFRKAATVSYFLLDSSYQGSMNALDILLKNGNGSKTLWPSDRDRPHKIRNFLKRFTRSQDAPARSDAGKDFPKDEILTRIYLFSEDGNTGNLISNVCARHKENAEHVMIRTVRSYRNAVVNLMYDVPLFLSFLAESKPVSAPHGSSISMAKPKDLCVTILGDSQIAAELFKAAYWCGQIYGVRLHLNVAAQNAQQFEQRIRQDCPELLPSCDPDSEILRVFPNDPDAAKNPPYSVMPRFLSIADDACFLELPEELLKKTDYFAVAFDSDRKNLDASDWLSQKIVQNLLDAGENRHPVIAVSIFDRVLGEAAEQLTPEPFHPYLIPFADRKSRFNCKNVFISDFSGDANESAVIYDKSKEKKERDDEYKFWANIARTIHVPYKMFGIGAVEGIRLHGHGVKSEYQYTKEIPYNGQQADELAWIEHRRWNAFMRSQGFCQPTKIQLASYYKNPGLPGATQKYVAGKLHSCLVESSVTPTTPAPWPLLTEKGMDGLDIITRYLDLLESRCRIGADPEIITDEALMELASRSQDLKSDYKQYDYPKYDEPLNALLLWYPET